MKTKRLKCIDALRQRKDFNPTGWEPFAEALGNADVPETLVRNARRLEEMREQDKTLSAGLATYANTQVTDIPSVLRKQRTTS